MNAFIDTILTPFVAFLLDWSLRWFVVAALPILWLWLRPPREARLRYQICLATLAAGLLLPVLPRWGGLSSVQPTPALEQTAALEVESPTLVSTSPPMSSPPTPTEPAPAFTNEVVVAPEPIASPAAPVLEPIEWRPLLLRGVIFVSATAWLAGVLILLARWIAGSLYLRQLRHTASHVDAATAELFTACRRELQVTRPVRLAVHAKVLSPLLLGPRGLTILLPGSWAQLPPALQRASLLHELAHVARRDDWIALALRVADLAMFFHPCYRWLRSRLECEREICCDDLTLASGVDAGGYAQMLRDFASQPGRFRSTSPAIPFGQPSTIKSRIQHILEENMLPRNSPTRWIFIAGALVLTLSAGIGSLRIYAAISPEPQFEQDPAQTKKESPRPAPPVVPEEKFSKEELTYGGKHFYDWVQILRSDLKPEVRAEAFQALSTFGKNGYGSEAAQAILEIAKTYNPIANDLEDHRVVEAANNEIWRLGRAAFPALEQELLHGRTNGRRFAALVFRRMNDGARPAVPTLERALKDEDEYVRGQVALSLANCSALKDPAGMKALQEVVFSVAKVGSPLPLGYELGDANDALKELSRQGKAARSVVPELATLLQIPTLSKTGLSSQVLLTILNIGGDPKTLVPVFEYQIRTNHYSIGPTSNGLAAALNGLAAAGQEARSAVPTLMRNLDQTPGPSRYLIIDTLVQIGADPKDLIPILKPMMVKWGTPQGTTNDARRSGPSRDQILKYREYLGKYAPESAKPSSEKPAKPSDMQSSWTPQGTLQRTEMTDSTGVRYYRFSYAQPNLFGMIYCQAGPGVNLDAQSNKQVRLYGHRVYRKELRESIMEVTQIQAAPTE